MRYINSLIPCLFMGFVIQINCYTWNVINQTNQDLTVRVNASGQKIEHVVPQSETRAFVFDGWKKGLCFTNMAVKQGKKWHTINQAPAKIAKQVAQSIMVSMFSGIGALTFLDTICSSGNLVIVKDEQNKLYFKGFKEW